MVEETKMLFSVKVAFDAPPLPNEETVEVEMGEQGFRVSNIEVTQAELISLFMSNQVDLVELDGRTAEFYRPETYGRAIQVREDLILRQIKGGTWHLEKI